MLEQAVVLFFLTKQASDVGRLAGPYERRELIARGSVERKNDHP